MVAKALFEDFVLCIQIIPLPYIRYNENLSNNPIFFGCPCGVGFCGLPCLLYTSWGGSVTLCSMLFIVLAANWYGVGTGITVGLAYGILQFIQEPYVLSFFQVCCDYILAFAALGVAGFFAKQSHGLLKGYIVAVIARGAFHALGGYLYWMSYMPDNFPKSLTAIYPIVYNYSYLIAEGIITVIVISIPAVSKALVQVKKAALGTSL